jgi:hypothetical protein
MFFELNTSYAAIVFSMAVPRAINHCSSVFYKKQLQSDKGKNCSFLNGDRARNEQWNKDGKDWDF